jgi:hypothetical protein
MLYCRRHSADLKSETNAIAAWLRSTDAIARFIRIVIKNVFVGN